MDLQQLRANNWYQMWSEVAVKEKQVTSLADQVRRQYGWQFSLAHYRISLTLSSNTILIYITSYLVIGMSS